MSCNSILDNLPLLSLLSITYSCDPFAPPPLSLSLTLLTSMHQLFALLVLSHTLHHLHHSHCMGSSNGCHGCWSSLDTCPMFYSDKIDNSITERRYWILFLIKLVLKSVFWVWKLKGVVHCDGLRKFNFLNFFIRKYEYLKSCRKNFRIQFEIF